MLYENPIYRIAGDRGLIVELGDDVSPEVNERLRDLYSCLSRNPFEGLQEILPGYRSICILYHPLKTSSKEVQQWVEGLCRVPAAEDPPARRFHRIPVIYGGRYGPDLEWVASFHGISTEEVVRLHSGTNYRVYVIGFMPGFAYLGRLPEALVTPRKDTPRTSVPRGSVAIAHGQTAVYPTTSPGGWQIIGWTPIRLFDVEKWPPSALEMGDEVRFFEIQEEDQASWQA